VVDEIPLLLVARLLDLEEVQAIVDAALRGSIALVPLEDPPLSNEKHAMVVHAPGLAEPVVLDATPAGEETGGLYPLKLAPSREEQVPYLKKLCGGARSTRPPRSRPTKPAPRTSRPPRSALASHPDRDERTLPDARADPLLGFVLGNGKYEIQSIIAAGAFGRVYRGRHRKLEKPVAIKVLHGLMERDAEFASRFQREALAASKLDHPNVAQVIDYGEEPDGMLYIVMELLDGMTLRDSLNESRPLPLPRIVELMTQLTGALAAAHDAGVVHRDIKPENVVLVRKRNDDGEVRELVKVCDFGIAAVQKLDVEGAPEYLSSGGTTVSGTPEYMAPEVARGEKVDTRSDIYACGVLLYEMATGVVPFTGGTPVAVLVAHVSDAPRPPSQLNPRLDKRLEDIILRALSKDANDRPKTARELRAELRALLHGSGELRAVRKSTLVPPIPREEAEDATPMPAHVHVRMPSDVPERTLTLPPQRVPVFAEPPSSLLDDETTPPQRSMDEPPAAVVVDANATPEMHSEPPPPAEGPPPESLLDPRVGFAEFLSAATAAVARTTYYERAHPEFARSLALLVSVMGSPLARRGEITFARQDRDSHELVVMTGLGENLDLVKAAPGGVGAGCAQRLGEVFSRRGLVSLTFKEGLDERELADAVELLSGPEIPPKELQMQFAARGLTKVSVLFVIDMLGRERRLPWQVMLCISRIARDLEAIPKIVKKADADRRKRMRTGLTSDVLRTLKSPEQAKILLMNWDLVADRVGEGAEMPAKEVPVVLVGALAHPMLLRVAGAILVDMEEQAAGATPGGSMAPPPITGVRRLMQIIGNRFVKERTIESDDVLRELHTRAVLSFPELPEDLQLWVLAEQQAEQLAVDPEPILRVLDTVFDVPTYTRDIATLARAMRV
jgi:serine/threonine protein kinase